MIDEPSDLSALSNGEIAELSYYNKIRPKVALAELHRIDGASRHGLDDSAWDALLSRWTIVRANAWPADPSVLEPSWQIPRLPDSFAVSLIDLTCTECGRSSDAGETWRILFAGRVAREALIYCPECAEREFGESV